MDMLRYVLAVFIVVGVPPGLGWWFVVHPFVDGWRRVGAGLTLTIVSILLLAAVVGLFQLRDLLVGPDLGLQWPLVGLGIVLIIASLYVQQRRRKHLTMKILIGLPEVQADVAKRGQLITEGPYAIVRHPRYIEFVLGAFGYAAIANYLGAWIVAVLTLPILHLVVLMEERELTQRFGDAYRQYASCVPRYLPKRPWKGE